MHASFLIAAGIFILALGAALLTAFGNGMSDAPTDNSSSGPISIVVGGTILAGLVASSHWWSW
jgi:hypothetical protein